MTQKAYEHPWTVTEVFQLLAGEDLLEYVCNENNLDPAHMLGKYPPIIDVSIPAIALRLRASATRTKNL